MTIISLAVLACGKKNAAVENESIVGKWRLTETLADPGDGSGKWQPADPLNPSYLEFRSDGSLGSSPQGSVTQYKLLSDSTLLYYTDTGPLQLRYTLTKTALGLYPPCIEACGMHYVAVKQ